MYHRYHRSSRYHPCHPWQRKIISQTFQLDLINQHPTLDVEKMVDPQITKDIFINGNSPRNFRKIFPGRLSKNIQTSVSPPPNLRRPKQKHQGAQVSGLRICIIQLQDHRISLLLQTGTVPPTFFGKSPGPSLRKWCSEGDGNGCFRKIVGLVPPNHPF